MDQGLNSSLVDDVITRQSSSSTVSSLSSITSPLHLSDIAASQPPASTAASQPHPPSELHLPTSCKASPLTSSQPCPQFASSSSCTDTATQTVVHTGVQTEHYHATPATVIPSQQSVASLAVSSQEYSKMEKLMATALLNAKDTINTIETLSQSLLLRNVSREASLASMPPGSYTQHVTYSQDVTNNPTVSVATVQDVVNHHTPMDKSNVINSQEVANNPAPFNARTNSQDAASTPVVTIQTSTQDSSHLQNIAMTPPSPSHGNHMVTPPQHNYTLYNEVAKDDSYRLVK